MYNKTPYLINYYIRKYWESKDLEEQILQEGEDRGLRSPDDDPDLVARWRVQFENTMKWRNLITQSLPSTQQWMGGEING